MEGKHAISRTDGLYAVGNTLIECAGRAKSPKKKTAGF
jgi:hypothetical protein